MKRKVISLDGGLNFNQKSMNKILIKFYITKYILPQNFQPCSNFLLNPTNNAATIHINT